MGGGKGRGGGGLRVRVQRIGPECQGSVGQVHRGRAGEGLGRRAREKGGRKRKRDGLGCVCWQAQWV